MQSLTDYNSTVFYNTDFAEHRTEKPPASSTGFDNPLVALPAGNNVLLFTNLTPAITVQLTLQLSPFFSRKV